MTADDLTSLVLASIADRWSETNLHGVDLREGLLSAPLTIEAVDVYGQQMNSVWLVLTECGVGNSGYGVVYSEPDDAFGLIQFATGYQSCVLGIYGTFWQAFTGM